jgi:hypothetical protein
MQWHATKPNGTHPQKPSLDEKWVEHVKMVCLDVLRMPSQEHRQ